MRTLKSLTIALVLGLSQTALAKPDVKTTDDFTQIAKISKARALPILMVFSSTGCAYCVLLENDFLRPMLISGDYTDKVIIRKVVIDQVGSVRDFNGKRILSNAIVGKYNISVTPTILFLDSHGHELTKRMVGVGTVDFFGGFLDQAIDQSYRRLHQTKPSVNLTER